MSDRRTKGDDLMEIEASVLLEAEQQAHLITVPCVLKCDLPVWKGTKVAWKGKGWYGLVDGIPKMVAPHDLDRPTLQGCGKVVCQVCLKGRRHETPLRPEPIVEEETKKRDDRIDMVYLEGNDDDGHPTSLVLLPEELAHLQGGQTYSSCPHLTAFYDREGCSIHGCGAM